MAEYLIQDTTLTELADAVRQKTGDTSKMSPEKMIEKINSIEVAGALQSKTVSPDYNQHIITPDSNYVGLQQVTVNAIPSNWIPLPEVIKAGDYPIYGLTTSSKITSTSYTDLDLYVFTANRAGTYRFKWCCMKPAVSFGSGGSSASALFLNDVSKFENTSFSDNVQYNTVDVAMNAGDVVRVKAKHSGGMYATYIYGVHVCIDWSDPNAFFV